MQKITIPLHQNPLSHQAYIKARLLEKYCPFCRANIQGKVHPTTYKDSVLGEFQQVFSMLAKSECNKYSIKRLGKEPYGMNMKIYCVDRRRPDFTNMFKTIEDALEGILYENDRYLESLHVDVDYDAKNPRVELIVYPLTEKIPCQNQQHQLPLPEVETNLPQH